jgi:Cu/Ag efflux protein CusF
LGKIDSQEKGGENQMKKLTALIVAILFVFAMSAVAFAAEKPAEPMKAEKKAEPAKVKQVTGEVTAVDAAANSVTVKGKKAEMTISADEKMLKDIKVGDKVTVKYTEKDGKNVAKSVKKAAAKAAPAPKAEKKAEPAMPAEASKK